MVTKCLSYESTSQPHLLIFAIWPYFLIKQDSFRTRSVQANFSFCWCDNGGKKVRDKLEASGTARKHQLLLSLLVVVVVAVTTSEWRQERR